MLSMRRDLKKQDEVIKVLIEESAVKNDEEKKEKLKELLNQHINWIKSEAKLDVLLFQVDKPDQEELILKNNLSKKIEEVRGFIKNEYPEIYEGLNYSEFIFRNLVITIQNMGEMVNENGKLGRVKWVKSKEYTDKGYEKYKKMMNKREEELLGKPQN